MENDTERGITMATLLFIIKCQNNLKPEPIGPPLNTPLFLYAIRLKM